MDNGCAGPGITRSMTVAATFLAIVTLSGTAVAVDPSPFDNPTSAAMATTVAPNPLLTIDQNRGTVVDRLMTKWGDALVSANAGVTRDQFKVLLMGLRADQLLGASLAGSLEGLRNVMANALTASAPVAGGLLHAKTLGDATDDLAYTPVTPCRIIDTRGGAGGTMQGGQTRNWLASNPAGTFATQGGANSNCGIPVKPTAVMMNITVLTLGAGPAFMTAWPFNQAQPNAALVNWIAANDQVGNAVAVPMCTGACASDFSVFTTAQANIVVDVLGYFASPNGGNISIAGNITLVQSTATAGNVLKNSNRFIHNSGTGNTFVGELAGNFSSVFSGGQNTGIGALALTANLNGSNNTATGNAALESNQNGSRNTAIGQQAMFANISGSGNTAVGVSALQSSTGNNNTAVGVESLYHNSGDLNAAFGEFALHNNAGGTSNTALGSGALSGNTAGDANTVVGAGAGPNISGSRNIAIGSLAALNMTSTSDNIHIGNPGVAGESGTIRIGAGGTHNAIYLSGILNSPVSGVPVLISGVGQLGVASSSARYKDDIVDMHEASAALMRLRPVTFHYKTDQDVSGRTLQYGLIAEEVAEVYPGLVARSADGQLETVMYQFLPPMLLNEYQKQQRTIETQAAQIANQAARVVELERDREEQSARTDRIEKQLQQMTSLLDNLGAGPQSRR